MLNVYVCVYVLVSQSYLTLCESTDCIACQVPLSMEFSRQEYFSGLLFPSPKDFPNPGIKPMSSIAGRLFTIWATGKLKECTYP